VSSYSIKYDNLDTLNGPFIKVTQLSGETSGRFRVARVFPTQKAFADGVIKEGIEPASDFPFGPYPTDTLKYHGDVTVEFQTPVIVLGGWARNLNCHQMTSPLTALPLSSGMERTSTSSA
jgi:hypothetical protein